jgi:probable addiction module antidote protein
MLFEPPVGVHFIIPRFQEDSQVSKARPGAPGEQLYRSFGAKGNPTLKTTLAVMKALGIKLTAKIPTAA